MDSDLAPSMTGTSRFHERINRRALSYRRLRWMGSHFASAFKPDAAVLTELLKGQIITQKCSRAPAASVTDREHGSRLYG